MRKNPGKVIRCVAVGAAFAAAAIASAEPAGKRTAARRVPRSVSRGDGHDVERLAGAPSARHVLYR